MNYPRSVAVSKTSRNASQRSGLLRLVPLCPAHSRAPCANRLMDPASSAVIAKVGVLAFVHQIASVGVFKVNEVHESVNEFLRRLKWGLFVGKFQDFLVNEKTRFQAKNGLFVLCSFTGL